MPCGPARRHTLTGRLSGTATWSNFPRIRTGYASPDARGIIHVDDGIVLVHPDRPVVADGRTGCARPHVPDRRAVTPVAQLRHRARRGHHRRRAGTPADALLRVHGRAAAE